MTCQPALDGRVLMGGVIIQNDVDVLAQRNFAVDLLEKFQPLLVAMEQKLRTPEGRRCYLRRQASVEPVVGIIKRVLGFEQFSLRGLQKVTLEWTLVCVAYNSKRLHKLQNRPKPKPKAPNPTNPIAPVLGELLGRLFNRFCLAFQ